MAEPFNSSTQLEDVPLVIQQQYMPKFEEEYSGRFGRTLNRLFNLDEMEVTGDGVTMQCEIAPGDSIRADTAALGPFAPPDHFEAGALKVRFNKSVDSLSDFIQISGSCQTNDLDLVEAGKGSIEDFTDRMYKQIGPTYEERLAQLRTAGRNGVLAQVNGTVTQNSVWYGAGAATPTNATGARCFIDNGSIANFRRGARVDFIDSVTGAVTAGNVRISDVNVSDKTIGINFTTSANFTPWISTGAISAIADNNYIVRSGEYNKGMYSLGAWLTRPTAGESFLGGVDRSIESNRWLISQATREGVAASQVAKSMFDDMAIALGFLADDEEFGPIIRTDPTIAQTLRNQIGEDSIIQIPTDDSRLKRFGNFGMTGLNYQHTTFGVVKINADPLAAPNSVQVLAMNTWKALYWGWKGLKPMKNGSLHWYRMPEATPNAGLSKILKCDFYALQCDFCKQPWKNGTIQNVTA